MRLYVGALQDMLSLTLFKSSLTDSSDRQWSAQVACDSIREMGLVCRAFILACRTAMRFESILSCRLRRQSGTLAFFGMGPVLGAGFRAPCGGTPTREAASKGQEAGYARTFATR